MVPKIMRQGTLTPWLYLAAAVAITTMVMNILKAFDIVSVMTGALDGSEVTANHIFRFIVTNQSRSMAIAVLLIALTIPITTINICRLRAKNDKAAPGCCMVAGCRPRPSTTWPASWSVAWATSRPA
jgi:hypothetical protein